MPAGPTRQFSVSPHSSARSPADWMAPSMSTNSAPSGAPASMASPLPSWPRSRRDRLHTEGAVSSAEPNCSTSQAPLAERTAARFAPFISCGSPTLLQLAREQSHTVSARCRSISPSRPAASGIVSRPTVARSTISARSAKPLRSGDTSARCGLQWRFHSASRKHPSGARTPGSSGRSRNSASGRPTIAVAGADTVAARPAATCAGAIRADLPGRQLCAPARPRSPSPRIRGRRDAPAAG